MSDKTEGTIKSRSKQRSINDLSPEERKRIKKMAPDERVKELMRLNAFHDGIYIEDIMDDGF